VDVVDLIDEVITHIDDNKVIEKVKKTVNDLMNKYPLFAY
jgi:glycine/serine hydroxymethyltransferase